MPKLLNMTPEQKIAHLQKLKKESNKRYVDQQHNKDIKKEYNKQYYQKLIQPRENIIANYDEPEPTPVIEPEIEPQAKIIQQQQKTK